MLIGDGEFVLQPEDRGQVRSEGKQSESLCERGLWAMFVRCVMCSGGKHAARCEFHGATEGNSAAFACN